MSLTSNTNTAPRRLVDDDTPAAVSRALVNLINTCETKPDTCTCEYLQEDSGLALSVIQSPYVIEQYICGGYLAQYDCELIYRTIPATDSQRLQADETLDALVTWLVKNIGSISLTGVTITKIDRTNLSALMGRYNNGAEDHVASLTLNYERI